MTTLNGHGPLGIYLARASWHKEKDNTMIPHEFQPNLNTQAVNDFIKDENLGQGTTYHEPTPSRQGYIISAAPKRIAGIFDEIENENNILTPLSMFWTRLEHYIITEGNAPDTRVISEIQISVPQEQKLKLSIWANLLIKYGANAPSAETRNEIEWHFSSYDFRTHGDLIQYVEMILTNNPNIKKEMLYISYSFSIEKVGDPKSYDEIRKKALDFYTGNQDGIIYPTPHDAKDPGERIGDNPKGWFATKGLRAQFLKYEPIAGFPDKKRDPLHEQDVTGRNQEDVLGDIAKEEARVLECAYVFKQHNYKIATLFEYPEFKMIWRERRIVLYRDDCGNEISIRIQVPIIQIRISRINLWAYMRYPTNTGEVNDLIAKVLERCAIRAALSGAVVGVALGNFAAAVAAFKAVFQRCIDEHIDAIIKCMIPGLSLLSEIKNDWEDFLVP